MKKHLVVSALVMMIMSGLALYFSPSALASWLIDRSGTLMKVDGAVLGDDSSEEIKNEKEMVKEQSELKRETSKQNAEIKRETIKQQTELKIKQNEKRVESLKTQAKYELKNESGKLEIKGEIKDKNGKIIETQNRKVEDGESLLVEQEREDGQVERVRINAVKNDKMEMIKNRIRTTSEYELKVGDKNEISVTLPNGKTREVALPDKALENLVAKGTITSVEGEGGTNQYELTAGSNGEPVYQVEGQVEKKFLGFLKLKFDQKVEVAASDNEDGTLAGDVVRAESREVSPLRRFLESLSR